MSKNSIIAILGALVALMALVIILKEIRPTPGPKGPDGDTHGAETNNPPAGPVIPPNKQFPVEVE